MVAGGSTDARQESGIPPVLLGASQPPRPEAQFDTLVLCPPRFQASLERWVDYRRKQNFRIQVQPPGRSAYEIHQQVRAAANGNRLRHVVIVGDAGARHVDHQDQVPTDYIMARVNVRFGSEPEIATDNSYVDISGNGVPDVSIGRIPVDSPEELTEFIDRVIAYETQPQMCDCQRRINFVAGVGGFGQLIDGVIEETTKQIIRDLVPGSIETSMTYGSWTSPYCPDPRRFSEAAIERFNEGCLFWVYIGHGARDRLDRVRFPDREQPILNRELVPQIECRQGSPIALFLSCYTGAVDDPEDCLAELMLKQQQGPVATIGGSRVTMPGAMALLSLEMLHEYFHGSAETLGELLLLSKQRMIQGSQHNGEYRQMIEGMARTLNPATSLKAEKKEHAHLLNLLGDPLLRIRRPLRVDFGGPKKAVAGQPILLSGKLPAAGKLRLELAYTRDRLPLRFARRRDFDPSDAALDSYQPVYEAARDLVCHQVELTLPRGLFSTEFTIPAEVHGSCVIRAVLESDSGLGLGSTDIEIAKPDNAATADQRLRRTIQ